MEFLVAQILSGVSLGGQYALIAVGYTMVYGILRLINFAHGDVFMCAGLMMVFMCASLPVYVSIPLMLVLTVLLGFVIGAFIIGICETVIKGTSMTVFSDAFTFALLIVVLVVKPTGLFGEKATDKV